MAVHTNPSSEWLLGFQNYPVTGWTRECGDVGQSGEDVLAVPYFVSCMLVTSGGYSLLRHPHEASNGMLELQVNGL